jgi:hypothetical protein
MGQVNAAPGGEHPLPPVLLVGRRDEPVAPLELRSRNVCRTRLVDAGDRTVQRQAFQHGRIDGVIQLKPGKAQLPSGLKEIGQPWKLANSPHGG